MADAFKVADNSPTVIARLDEIARQVENTRPAYQAIGELLTESTKQRFSDSIGPDGQRWAPNAPATILSRLNQVKGAVGKRGKLTKKGAAVVMAKKPLVETGILQDTISYNATDSSVEIGTNRFAGEWDGGAAVHQFGSRNGLIPARPFLGVSADDERTVLEVLGNFLRQQTGAQ